MADKLGVDNDELTRFMKLLNKSTDSMKAIRKAMAHATISGLGTDDLDGACEDFQSDWKYGAGQIGEQTEALAKIIEQSKKSYAEVDKALERAMEESRRKSSGKAKGAK